MVIGDTLLLNDLSEFTMRQRKRKNFTESRSTVIGFRPMNDKGKGIRYEI